MRSLGILFCGIASCFLLSAEAWAQVNVHNAVSDAALEKNLQSLEIKYKKGEELKRKKDSISYYDFKRGDNAYRLKNYHSDLWIECVFDKTMPLEEINRWNAEAKFSRVVLLKENDKSSISLEAQLDCNGGVTDAMIKQFVNRFDEETKKFVKSSAK